MASGNAGNRRGGGRTDAHLQRHGSRGHAGSLSEYPPDTRGMPLSAASRRNISAVQFVRDCTEAPPFVTQTEYFAPQGQSDLLRLLARSLDCFRSRHGNLGVPEVPSARLGSEQRCPDSLGYGLAMLSRSGSDESDRCPICFRHIDRHELNILISQQIDKGSAPTNGAESRYHQCCIMTLGAFDGFLEMRPSLLMRSLIFGKFVDQRGPDADEAPHGLGLCRQGSVPAAARSAPHPVVGHIPSQGFCPSSSTLNRR